MKTIRIALAVCGVSMMLTAAGCHSLQMHAKGDCCGQEQAACKKEKHHGGLLGCLGHDKKEACGAACGSAESACQAVACEPKCETKHPWGLCGGKKECRQEAACGEKGQCKDGHTCCLAGKKQECCDQAGCCEGKCKQGHDCCLLGGKKGCCKDGCQCAACDGQCFGKCNGKCHGPCGACGCAQHQDQLISPLGLNVRQTMHIGEMQVDECKLEQILESRRRMRAEEQRVYNEYVRAQEQFYRDQRERQLRQYIDSLSAAGNCARPLGDPCPPPCPPCTPLCQLPPPPPPVPLRPTEIPLVIPVTLEVGIENTCLGQPCVRNITLPPACKVPCPPTACPTAVPPAIQGPAPAPTAPAELPPAPAVGKRTQPTTTASADRLPIVTPASRTKAETTSAEPSAPIVVTPADRQDAFLPWEPVAK